MRTMFAKGSVFGAFFFFQSFGVDTPHSPLPYIPPVPWSQEQPYHAQVSLDYKAKSRIVCSWGEASISPPAITRPFLEWHANEAESSFLFISTSLICLLLHQCAWQS